MGRLKDKVALITGGASGIGAASARKFLAEGAKVIISDVQVSLGEAVAAETGATFVRHDVAREADWTDVMKVVQQHHGRLDIILNNAGIIGGTNVADIELDVWNRIIGINLTGVMLGCKHAIGVMRKNPGGSSGSIINMCSNSGILGVYSDAAYCASKGGVRLLTKSTALYCAKQQLNIRCNSIHPGVTMTPIFDPFTAGSDDPEAALGFLSQMSPTKRICHPDEIAMMAVFLASDEAPYATGAEFVVDGAASSGLHDT